MPNTSRPTGRFVDAANQFVTVDGPRFAWRELGPRGGVLLVLLKDFLDGLKERRTDRDKGPSPRAFLRQLSAIQAWGRQAPQDLGRVRIPVLVANGDNDIMVPTSNSRDMARRIPGAELVIHPDAGHGGIFQHHSAFGPKALAFPAA